MSERSFAPTVAPELVLTIEGADRTLRPASYRVGRDPGADIVVIDSRVSWNHAVLRAEGDAWFVEDCGSRNGTFVGSDRVDRFEIDGQCIVRLGSADDGPALICAVSPPRRRPGRRADSTFRPSREDLRSTVVLPGPARVLHGALPGVPPLAELIVDVAVFSVTLMALGLLISALAGSQDLALISPGRTGRRSTRQVPGPVWRPRPEQEGR